MSDVTPGGHAIETLQVEERRYKPDPAFSKQANAKPGIYKKGFDEFWTRSPNESRFSSPGTSSTSGSPPTPSGSSGAS